MTSDDIPWTLGHEPYYDSKKILYGWKLGENMKIIKLVIIVLGGILLLSACAPKHNSGIQQSGKEKPIEKLLTKEYTDTQLDEISKLQYDLDKLNSQYPIERLSEEINGFRATYRSDKNIVIVYFDADKKKIMSQKEFITKQKSYFDNIKIGQSLDEVRNLDKSGNYIFLYTGREDTPKISYHYTNDGYIIKISYDDELKVTSVQSELI